MPAETMIVEKGPANRTVRTVDGQIVQVPETWELLPPGDAAMTRRVKAGGPTWLMQKRKGRRTFSEGIWADRDRIASVRADLEAERATESWSKKRQADRSRRERKQRAYVEDFQTAVFEFLNFDSAHAGVAIKLAEAVTRHATPVGSGTVARTQRISVERRAESAVIAWLRHRTTAYDDMKIPRVRGKRREVRQTLAGQSRKLLERYRSGASIEPMKCPLWQALYPEDLPEPGK